MGESFKVCFRFDSDKEIFNPLFGMGIENSYNLRIASINNLVTGEKIAELCKSGIVSFFIKNPNIYFGKYSIAVSIVSEESKWIDFISSVNLFEIHSVDIYGSGKILTLDQGFIFINSQIEFKSCEKNKS